MSALSRYLRRHGILAERNPAPVMGSAANGVASAKAPYAGSFDYIADGVGVTGKSLDFMNDPKFVSAWKFTAEGNKNSWPGGTPDIRWRAHMACWAAAHGLNLEGDFVECGVHTGLLSMTLCHYLDFSNVNKRLYLFDTYAGIPLETLSGEELASSININKYYFDCFEIASNNFRPFRNATLVKGILPQSLTEVSIDKIAYLSMDLNNSVAEKAVIEILWPKLVPSAIVLIDDYGFVGSDKQKVMWDEFAASQSRMIATLPTGQGLLIR